MYPHRLPAPRSAPATAPTAASWWCPVCGDAVPVVTRPGRRRVYCTNACRQRAYRRRRATGIRTIATPAAPIRTAGSRPSDGRTHAVRDRRDPVGWRSLGNRRVTACGTFAQPAPDERFAAGTARFLPDSSWACRACAAVVNADPHRPHDRNPYYDDWAESVLLPLLVGPRPEARQPGHDRLPT